MAVRLRLRREGTKKQPHYRVVAADKRAPRNGRFIEIIGEYHPLDDPSRVEIDNERALHWLRHGAQPSSQVKKLLRIVGVWQEFKPGDEPERERSKLTQEQAEEAARQRAEAEAAREEEAAEEARAEREAAEAEEAKAEEAKAEEEAAAAEAEADAAATDEDAEAAETTETEDEDVDAAAEADETGETDETDETDEDTEDES